MAPTDVRSWQVRYRFDDKPKTVTLGKYPTLSLSQAREAAEKQRRLAADGKDLTAHKRLEKIRGTTEAATTFGVVSDAWLKRETKRREWTEDYRGKVEASIKNHLGFSAR